MSSEKSRPAGPVVKAEEPLVSYEQVLLSQISHCSKIRTDFEFCVDNLVSLLPPELKSEVFKEFNSIIGLLQDYILEETNKCKLVGGFLECTVEGDEFLVTWSKTLSRVKKERPDLYFKYRHTIDEMIFRLLISFRPSPFKVDNAYSKLMFSIVIQKLLESQIIAPKNSAIHVGHVQG
jgi:hypothetical protein